MSSIGVRNEIAIPAAVATVMLSWAWLERRRRNAERLHMSYFHPVFPLAIRVICKLPGFLRRPMLIQGSAPKVPLDGVDLIGPDYDPYEIKELETNKLWRVRYRYLPDPALLDAMSSLFGIDMTDKSIILDGIQDEKMKKNVEQHMDRAAELKSNNQGLELNEKQLNTLKAGLEDSHDMLVARLENDNGLLIYNPCRMHPKIVSFLNSLGPVKYIVSGSSVHTNQLPQAATVFKDAKTICAEAADLKCQVAGMKPADFVYTNHDDQSPRGYQAAVLELTSHSVQLFHVAGDVQTQTLVVIAHGHLFETDLTSYGNGERWFHLDEDDWENPPPSLNFKQTFYYAGMQNATIAGYLPDYRLMAMDPASNFGKLMLDEPTATCCSEMADSLRDMLRLDFQFVDNVHSVKRESLPADEFRRCVENQWNWLDGKSLLNIGRS